MASSGVPPAAPHPPDTGDPRAPGGSHQSIPFPYFKAGETSPYSRHRHYKTLRVYVTEVESNLPKHCDLCLKVAYFSATSIKNDQPDTLSRNPGCRDKSQTKLLIPKLSILIIMFTSCNIVSSFFLCVLFTEATTEHQKNDWKNLFENYSDIFPQSHKDLHDLQRKLFLTFALISSPVPFPIRPE